MKKTLFTKVLIMDILSVVLEVLHVSANEHVTQSDVVTVILVLN